MTDTTRAGTRRRRATDPPYELAPGEKPVDLDELLAYLIRTKGSDLHITPDLPPMARIDGELAPVPDTPMLGPEACSALLDSVMSLEQREQFDAEHELDFSFGRRGLGRYRVNAFMQRCEPAMAIRRIPDQPPTIDELGLPPILAELARLRRGLILVTGPSGSGKTSTLAAMISQINHERTEHIITIEDPIEFVHRHDRSIVQQREIGRDTPEFAVALRSALREDPDVILIGEMRDLETISAAVSAAETGHLVFATLHTNSASQAVDRIIDVFPPDQQTQIRTQLSASLASGHRSAARSDAAWGKDRGRGGAHRQRRDAQPHSRRQDAPDRLGDAVRHQGRHAGLRHAARGSRAYAAMSRARSRCATATTRVGSTTGSG